MIGLDQLLSFIFAWKSNHRLGGAVNVIQGFQNVLKSVAISGKVGSCNNLGTARPLKLGESRVSRTNLLIRT